MQAKSKQAIFLNNPAEFQAKTFGKTLPFGRTSHGRMGSQPAKKVRKILILNSAR
jgi:hypothetical protein